LRNIGLGNTKQEVFKILISAKPSVSWECDILLTMKEFSQEQSVAENISLPKDESEVVAWDTASIVRCMDKIQMGYEGFVNSTPEERQEKYDLLSAEFKKRVQEYVVPEEFIIASKELTSHPSGETEADYEQNLTKWQSLSDTDGRYLIAAMFNSAELPINSHNRQELIDNARKQVQIYFRTQARL